MIERDREDGAAPLVPSELTANAILLTTAHAPSTFYKTMTSALRPRGTVC